MNGCDCWGPDGRLDTNIDQFEKCHISMSYASFFIIWHLMSYDAYDIEIWRKSNWSILVSKRSSGPQQSHPFICCWLENCFKIWKLKNASEIFSLYKFWKSFVFLAELKVVCGNSKIPWKILELWISFCFTIRNDRTICKNVLGILGKSRTPYSAYINRW